MAFLENRKYSIRLNFNPEDAILICSEPRGGSTWLAEVLRKEISTVVLWEPFTGDENNPFKRLGLHWRQNLPEDVVWPELSELLLECFKGQTLDTNSAYLERLFPSRFLRANRLILKCVHANGMLPWITNQICFRHPPIYLLRHPFAVVLSQKRHGAWKEQEIPFQIPNCPYNEIFKRHSHFLSTLKSFEEVMTANWCLSNIHTLNHPNPVRWHTLYYEHLREQGLVGLFRHFELPVPRDVGLLANKPSRTTRGSGPTSLDSWQQEISVSLQGRMQRVLDTFGVTQYSKDSPFPLI